MSANFWKKSKKPFFALAPMYDVTDRAFRQIIAKYGKPDVIFTEFVSADGLCSAGKKKLLHLLKFTDKERPIVAQIFGANPESIKKAAVLIRELGFDGLDINMGCPDRAVEKQGAGAALMKNPKLAKEIIKAALVGARDIPVSVKTRIGYKENELKTWLPALLECELAAVIIHARTRKEMSNAAAHWEAVKEAVKIRDKTGSETLIVGNGDVSDLADAKKKAVETNCDGVMIGRAVFGAPWFFAEGYGCVFKNEDDKIKKKLKIMLEHARLFEKFFVKKNIKSFAVMKRHFKAYVSGFQGAKDLRDELMRAKNSAEIAEIIGNFQKTKK